MAKIVTVGKHAHHVPSLSLALADADATEIVMHPGRYVEHVVIAPTVIVRAWNMCRIARR
jgi:hypothetical protein